MPYNNPENKRQWEKEHRELRNAQRRAQRLGAVSRPVALNPEPDPDQETRNGWGLVIALVVGLGSALLGILSGVHLSKGR